MGRGDLPFTTDLAVKRAVIGSYFGPAHFRLWAFLALRTLVLPLKEFDGFIPRSGKVVEIGCGHGLVAQYLARRSPARQVIGYDPDERRIPTARAAAKGLANLEYRQTTFEDDPEPGLAAVIINGVLYLLPDEDCLKVLKAVRNHLTAGGVLVFSDVLVAPGRWRYRFHVARERVFAEGGFTRGQGLFFRTPEAWQGMLAAAGFRDIRPFHAPVAMHSVLNYVCR